MMVGDLRGHTYCCGGERGSFHQQLYFKSAVCFVQLYNFSRCWLILRQFSSYLGMNALAKACPFDYGSPVFGFVFFWPVSLGFWPPKRCVAWQAQGFRVLRCRCLKPPTQNPWKGCKFYVTEVLLCRDHFAWQF